MQIDTIEEGTSLPADKYSRSGPGAPKPEETSSLDAGRLVQIVNQNKRAIVLVAIVSLAISAIVAFSIPSSYTAVASLIPPTPSSNSFSALAGQLGSVAGIANLGSTKSSSDLYVGILASSSIARKLVSRFDLMRVYGVKKESAAEKKLAKHSNFEAGIRDGIVTIRVTEHRPELARDLANAYLEQLRETNGRLALTEAAQRRLFFEQQLNQEKSNLENADVELKKLEESTGIIAPAGQTTIELQTIAQTRAEIAAREVKLAALLQSATDQNSDVVRLRSEIASLQSQLRVLEHGGAKPTEPEVPKSKVPEIKLEYIRQQREVSFHEALFGTLAKQLEQARLDESHDAPVLQVLDYATVPDTKSGPYRSLIMLGGLFVGILIGVAWVLIRNKASILAKSA